MVKMNARGFNLTEKTKVAVEKELKKIKKMLPKHANFEITISNTKKVNECCCVLIVKDAGDFIKTEAFADSADASINFAVDSLKRKVRKLKNLLIAKKRKQINSNFLSLDESVNFEHFESDDVCERKKIVKTNKILLQMMDEEEAVAQMETLGRNHFIYIGEDGNTRLIYRLEKDGYGLLICEG